MSDEFISSVDVVRVLRERLAEDEKVSSATTTATAANTHRTPAWNSSANSATYRAELGGLRMTTADLALHLASNILYVAKHESAGACYHEIHHAVDTIERAINRPPPARFLGPCRTPVDDGHDKHCTQQHPHPCGIALQAKIGDTETRCPTCHTHYNIDRLLQQQLDDTDDMSFTLSQLYKTILPVNREYVPLSTLRHWIARGHLVPTGHDTTGEPRYLLADVRELRDAKPQRATTGGAAHKKPAS